MTTLKQYVEAIADSFMWKDRGEGAIMVVTEDAHSDTLDYVYAVQEGALSDWVYEKAAEIAGAIADYMEDDDTDTERAVERVLEDQAVSVEFQTYQLGQWAIEFGEWCDEALVEMGGSFTSHSDLIMYAQHLHIDHLIRLAADYFDAEGVELVEV